MINLPKQVNLALCLIEENGYEAFIVGGCVRDYLLGKEPMDIDITTSAKPSIIMEIFRQYTTIPTGLKHGTVTVIIDSIHLEITTYRIEGEYIGNRKPKDVSFTLDIKEDLKRRDFTINAIAYHPLKGFIDPYGGEADIKNKVIRAVGQGSKRFEEDALRILRGVRFSSTLGFSIEENTFFSMEEKKDLLKNISVERVYCELCKTLLGDNVKNAFEKSSSIWGVVIPEILEMVDFQQNNNYHIYDVFIHTLVAVENTKKILHLRLASFFHDIGKPYTYTIDEKGVGHFYSHPDKSHSITKDILNKLKCDNATKDKVLTLVKYHDTPIICSNKNIKRWLNKLSPELFFDLLDLKKADNLGQNPKYHTRQEELEDIKILAKEIIEERQCFSLKDLEINGRDLICLGYKGREIGEGLNTILEKVMNNKIENRKEILIEYVKDIKQNKGSKKC